MADQVVGMGVIWVKSVVPYLPRPRPPVGFGAWMHQSLTSKQL